MNFVPQLERSEREYLSFVTALIEIISLFSKQMPAGDVAQWVKCLS